MSVFWNALAAAVVCPKQITSFQGFLLDSYRRNKMYMGNKEQASLSTRQTPGQKKCSVATELNIHAADVRDEERKK